MRTVYLIPPILAVVLLGLSAVQPTPVHAEAAPPAAPAPVEKPPATPAAKEEAPPAAPAEAPAPATPPAPSAPPAAAPAPVPPAAPVAPAAPSSAAPVAPAIPPAVPVAAAPPDEIRFQFDGIPYTEIIRRFAQIKGKPIIGDYTVEGNLTFFDSQPYTRDEAFDTFNLLLAMRGFTMVETPRYLQVVAIKDAARAPMKIVRGWAQTEGVRPGEFITMMLPLKYIGADDALKILQPIVSSYGSLAALGRGRGIVITDRLANIQRMRSILDDLDTGTLAVERQLKTYVLKRASARDLATIINSVLGGVGATSPASMYERDSNGQRRFNYDDRSRQWVPNPEFKGPPLPSSSGEGIKATADERTNTLFLVGAGDKIAMAEEIINRLDAIEPAATGDMRIFELKNAKAEDVANTIRQTLPGATSGYGSRSGSVPGSAPGTQAKVVADAGTNRLIVTAPLDQMSRIEDLVRQLDLASKNIGGMRVFRLKVADAQQLAGVLANALRRPDMQASESERWRSGTSAQVSADARTNSLLVFGTAGEIQTAEALINELDKPVDAQTMAREIHVVQLKVGDARPLAEALTRMLSQQDTQTRWGRSISNTNVRVEAEPATNSLLISVAPGDWPIIEKILDQLKASAMPMATASTRIIPLQHAKAADVAEALRQVYGGRRTGSYGRRPYGSEGSSDQQHTIVPVVIAANERSNSLLVSAADDDQKAIAELIKTLDVPSSEKVDPIRIIHLKSGDATKVAETLRGIMPQADRSEPQRIFIQADVSSNSLVIRAPEAEFKTLEQMAAQLDQAITASGGIKTFRLKVADAQQVASVLQNALARRETGRQWPPAPTTVVSADARTNSVIVAGPAGDIQTAETLINELDKPLDKETREIHVVQLKAGDARQLAEAMTRMLSQPETMSRWGRSVSTSAVRVEAEPATNSLLISASPGDWPVIEKLLEQLRATALPMATATTRVIPVKYARASDLAETLRQIFGGSRRPGAYGRRSYGGDGSSDPQHITVPVVIAASDRTNSLLVSAADDDQKAIAELVKTMDVKESEAFEAIRMIRLQSADAVKLADTLRSMVPPSAQGQSSILIQADALSNSVLLRAPEVDRKMFEEMIGTLDKATQQMAREVRMIAVKNVSAATLVQMLNQLYQSSTVYSGSRRYGQPQAEGAERVIVAAAPGDRAIVVDAPREKIEEIAQLVASLDVADAPGTLQIRIYRLANAKAAELAPSLGRLFAQQREQRYGRTGVSETEPQPHFEADLATNQVMVAATPAQFTLIEDLIKKLETGTSVARETRTYRLQAAKASEIARVLQTMLADTPAAGGTRGRYGEEPSGAEIRVAAMDDTNDIVVQGPPEKLALAEQLIKTFDTPGAGGQSGITIVLLKNAQAASLAEAVNAAISQQAAPAAWRRYGAPPTSEKTERVTVTPEPNSNSVLVRGPAADVPAVVEMIRKLDEGSTSGGTQVRIFPLQNSEPAALAQSLGKLFQDMLRQQAGGRNQQPPPFSITADERTRSLVVSTTPSYFAIIEQLLKALDQAPGAPTQDVQYVWLKDADATDVASKLTDLYRDRKGADKPVISADTFSNAVTIIAKDADLKAMEPIIAKLDDAAKDNNFRVRVIPLTAVKADKMAEILKTVYHQLSGNEVNVTQEVPPELKSPDGGLPPIPEPPKKEQTPETPAKGGGKEKAAGKEKTSVDRTSGRLFEAPLPRGVSIAIDKGSNSLIISGKRQELDYLENLITQLSPGAGGGEAEFRIFKVEQADAAGVARTLDALFNPKPVQMPQGGRGAQPAAPPPPPVISVVADSRTKSLIIRAKPLDFELIEPLIKHLDQVPVVISAVRVFTLKNTAAEDVATNIKDLFRLSQQQRGPLPQEQLQPQGRQGGRQQQPQQQRAEMIRQMLELQNKDGVAQVDAATMISVSANRQTNSVIVAAPSDAMEIVARLVEELDQSGVGAATSVHLYPIKNAEVRAIVSALQDIFVSGARVPTRMGPTGGMGGRGGQAPALEPNVVVTGDEVGRLVIVSAPADKHELIAKVIQEMDDAQKTGDVTVKVYRLTNADATTVAAALQGTLEHTSPAGGGGRMGRGGAAAGAAAAGQVRINADRSSNSLIVRAGAEDHDRIVKLLQEMDVSPIDQFAVRLIPLTNADATNVAQALTRVFGVSSAASAGVRGGGQRGLGAGATPARSPVVIEADRDARMLMVRADDATFEKILKMAQDLDKATGEVTLAVVKTYPIKNADVRTVVTTLQDIFSGGGRPAAGRGGARTAGTDAQAIVVSGDEGGRLVIVSAPAEKHELIAKVINEIDQAQAEDQVAVKVYRLANADATTVAAALSATVDRTSTTGGGSARTGRSGGAGGSGAALAGLVRISADRSSNSLVVRASSEDHERIAKLIQEMDVSPVEQYTVRLIPLKNADSTAVAQVLSRVFASTAMSAGAAGGRGAGAATGTRSSVIIESDRDSRTLMVRADDVTFEKVKALAEQLDTSSPAGQASPTLISLKHAQASSVAAALSQAFVSPKAARGTVNLDDQVTVVAEPVSNSIIVTANPLNFEKVKVLLEKMDSETTGGMRTELLVLKNARATDIAPVLTGMIRSTTGTGGRAGAGGQPSVSVTAEVGSNALVLSGPSNEVDKASKMAQQLDLATSPQAPTVRIIPLKNGDAAVVASMVRDLYNQQVMQAQREHKSIDTLAVSCDARANALVLATSDAMFTQVSQWVNQIEVMQPSRGALKIITLQHADPAEVEKAIRQLYGGGTSATMPVIPIRRGAPGAPGATGPTAPGGKVETTVLPQQRSILIGASDEDFETIQRLAEALDAAAADAKRQFRVFALKNTSNTHVATALNNLYRQAQPRVGVAVAPDELVTVTALPDTNAVVVSAAASKMEDVAHLIEELDKVQIAPQLEFHIVPLTSVQPTKIMPLLTPILAQLRQTRPDEPVSVHADERTKSIIVTARPLMFEQVEKIIKTLDKPPAYAETEVLIIPLKKADATRLAIVLTDMLQPNRANQVTVEALALQEQVRLLRIHSAAGQELPELDLTKPIKITADPTVAGQQGSNALVISSTADNLKAMKAVVELLDTVPVIEGVKVKVVHLLNADATGVMTVLKDVFTQGQKLAGRPQTSVEGKAQPESSSGKALVNTFNVSADERTNTLVMSGLEESLALADLIVKDLDRDAGKVVTEVRLFRLKNADATKMVPVLQAVFGETAATAPGSEGLRTQVTRLRTVIEKQTGHVTEIPKTRAALTIQADPSTSILIVAARADVMPLLADVIQTMDIPGAGSLNTVRIFPLVNADATRLKGVLDGLYTGPNAQLVRPEDKPNIEVDIRTNALVVSASEKTFAMVGTLLKSLDAKTPIEMRDIRLIPLKSADAATLAPTLQKMMDARVQRLTALNAADAEALRVIIVPDTRSNMLMVGGSAEGYELLKSLAEQLDGASPALEGQVQLFPLAHANAGSISATLTNLFTQRYAAARTPDVQRQKPIVLADVRVNALLVAANPDDTRIIEGLLKKLDVELQDPSVQLVVLPLKYNDAGIVGPKIQQLFAARLTSMTLPGQTPVPQDRVDVATDDLSNSLIVSASKENLALIKGLLEKVDVLPPDETGIVRLYTLQNSDAQRIATMLQGLVTQGLYKPGLVTAGGNASLAAREKVSITVDVRTNTLIISASRENFAILEEVIKKIDATDDFAILGDIRLFTLKNANATRLAPILQQLFTAKRAAEQAAGGTGRMLPVSVFADARTNTLLVTGSKESFNAVEAMVRELDTDQVLAANEFRVFYLKQATASVLQPTLQQLFAQRVARGDQKDPVTIVTEDRTNALIVTASPEDMKLAESLISRLDAEPDRPGFAVQVFPLLKADATQVSKTLQSLYKGPGVGQQGAATVGISIDERINAIVVSAGPADLKRIGELCQQLDTDTVPRVTEIRVFTLENSDATELATILTSALNNKPTPMTAASPNRQALLQFVTRSKDGGQIISSGLQEGVLITPDRRTNSIVISAPLENMPLLESIVRAMDSTSPRTAEIRVFTLVNADARAMATVLQQLFKMQAAGGGVGAAAGKQTVQYTLAPKEGEDKASAPSAMIGSAQDTALTVTVDIRTNSLLIGGTKHYVDLASKVIEELDASTTAERLTEVYRLRNAKAQDIETSVTRFLTQERQFETQAMGTTGGGTAQYILEREVAIVAEPTSNTLLLSASPRYFDTVASMIQELDQPPPQVLIQVLLAEVTIDDTTDLGINWSFTDKYDHGKVFNAKTNFSFATSPGFSVSLTGGDITMFLRALESMGRLEILSRPQILASDNQPANINIGQRVPFITNSNVTSTGMVLNTVQYQQVGIILDVTPRINPDGFVKLEVKPEISSIADTSVDLGNGVKATIINNRSADTIVTVQDGHTIVVGGLITTKDNNRVDKVPFLGDIPLLGLLFRSTHVVKERTELLIILTPTVLRNIEEADIETEGQVKRLNLLRQAKRDPLQETLFKSFNNGAVKAGGVESEKVAVPAPVRRPEEDVKKPAAAAKEKEPLR